MITAVRRRLMKITKQKQKINKIVEVPTERQTFLFYKIR